MPPLSALTYESLSTHSQNLTALHSLRAPPWVNSPSMRGTSDILTSCLLTLFACIYTALHLNVPKQNAGSYGLFKVKCLWSVAALAAPEIVLFYAGRQFFEARGLVGELRGLEGDRRGEEGVGVKEDGEKRVEVVEREEAQVSLLWDGCRLFADGCSVGLI